jgi:hypothetical protein
MDPSCLVRFHSSLMMEAARTSETSVDNYYTRQNISEDNSEPSCLVMAKGSLVWCDIRLHFTSFYCEPE